VTRCEDARALLLEADLGELLGEGPSELAVHVRQCAACAELGQRILDGQAALSGVLGEMAERVAVDADPARARSGVAGLPAGAGRKEEAAGARPRAVALPSGAESAVRKKRLVWRVALPLAAAAAAALALFQLPGPTGTGVPFVPPELAQRGMEGGGGLVAAASPETNVAVLPTDNPDITVVWFIR
jgi:hypothetical protein